MRRRGRRPSKKSPKVNGEIEFEIEHMDPLGQGVSKDGDKVSFIAGTLPGEVGTASVYKRAKGVQFARLGSLAQKADNRVEPSCPHFSSCPGCQFLHTDYDSELSYKKATLLRYLAPLGVSEKDIEMVRAPRRDHYRNRLQLHYRHKYIGMLDTVSNQVLEIPDCQILRPELQEEFDRLYKGGWSAEHSGHGHCEIYFRSGKVNVQWDSQYAHGGFSQVFEEMNEVLQVRAQSLLDDCDASLLLDLFSGSGNLSDQFAQKGGERLLVDSHAPANTESGANSFHQMDLYAENTLANFSRKIDQQHFDTLLLDPPRRGFADLNLWIKKFKPKQVVYVSCNPASLARDLRNLSSRFRFKSLQLLDLFPGTAHFETLVMLEIRKPE
jgi:23S rRNA (uracil1939-C5)-methyltransferase